MMDQFISCCRQAGRLRASIGMTGIALASIFPVWLLLGWIGWLPSMVDLFGVEGMRTPASFTVGGLMIAAIAFWDC